MKFFLDENFPRPALTYLVSAGHSAAYALNYFPPGTDDEKLFERAQSDDAIFITADKDFFHTIPSPLHVTAGRLSSPCANPIARICFGGWRTPWHCLATEICATRSGW